MGSGASFDNGLNLGSSANGDRYFCHSCHRVFGLGNVGSPTDFYCPHCQSTFLEEMGGESGFYDRTSEVIAVRHRNQSVMTVEQARRMANATAMLRLLESQLREELEHLQRAVGTFTMNNDTSEKPKKLTKLMRGRLRNTTVNLDLICGQPSCPICNEEFILGGDALKIPCSHIFHKDCVIPWLEMKQTCPICRAVLNGDLPTKEEIGNFTTDELTDRLNEADVVILNSATKSKSELVDLLHEKWSELHQNDNDEDQHAVTSTHSNSRHHMLPVSINAVMTNASTMTNRAHNFNFMLQAPAGLDLHDNDDDDEVDDNTGNNIMSEVLLPASRRVPGRLFNEHQQQQQQPWLMDSTTSVMEMSRSERPLRSTSSASASAGSNDHLRWSFADTEQAPRLWPNTTMTTTFQIVPTVGGGQQQYSVVARPQPQQNNNNNETRDNTDSET